MSLIKFRVGEAAPANTFFAIWMAEACGLYEARGLNLEIVEMVGGSKTGPALSSNEIQLMHIGMSSVVRANLSGFEVTTIGSLSNVIRSTFFAHPDIELGEQLKGGKIGISSVGSESELSTILAFRKLGLTREDVTFEEIGNERLSFLRKKQVRATMLGEPLRSVAFEEGMNPIVDLLADRIPWLYSGLVVDKNFLVQNRVSVLNFMRATIEGNYMAVSQPKRAKNILATRLKINNTKNLDLTYENFKTFTPLNCELTKKGGQNIIKTINGSPTKHSLKNYMDDSIYRELKREGFFLKMKHFIAS